jgi:hypothetical protein
MIIKVTEDQLIHFIADLPGVVAVTASEANGAPKVAWGDSFFFYDPEGDVPAERRLPFATIVTQDYDGFDMASNLNRHGIYRLNLAVGRVRFEELVGYPPAHHAAHEEGFDYTALDCVLPHPVYAAQAYVSILNPGDKTSALARSLIVEAHRRAAEGHRRRRGRAGITDSP